MVGVVCHQTTPIGHVELLYGGWCMTILSVYVVCCMSSDQQLVASKNRLSLEVATHRITCQKQWAQIDVLTNALTEAKGYDNGVRPQHAMTTIYMHLLFHH